MSRSVSEDREGQSNMASQITPSIHYTANDPGNLPPLSASVPPNFMYNNNDVRSPRHSESGPRDESPRSDDVRRSTPERPDSEQLGQYRVSEPSQSAARHTEYTQSAATARDSSTAYEQDALEHREASGGPSEKESTTGRHAVRYESEDDDYASQDSQAESSRDLGQVVRPKPFSKKNLKRHRLSHSETRFLLNEFGQNPHPDATQRAMLAKQINGLTARQIQVWFQNRRAKLKRMSAADADRMLSTRSYPEGYGPQGMGDRASVPQDPVQSAPYAQPIEGVYASHGFSDRYLYPPRHPPPRMLQQQHSYFDQESSRTPHAIGPPAHWERGTPRSPLADGTSHYRCDSPRSPYPAVHSAYADPSSTSDRSLQAAQASPYAHESARNYRSPQGPYMRHGDDRPYSALPRYPRSAPLNSHFPALPTPTMVHQSAHMDYVSDGDSRDRRRDIRSYAPQFERHFDHGDTRHSKTLDRYEDHPDQESYLSPIPTPRAPSSFPYTPISRTMDVLDQAQASDAHYSDIRESQQDQYHHASSEHYRLEPAPRDVHYYYGTEEHMNHEEEELREARKLYHQEREQEHRHGRDYTQAVTSQEQTAYGYERSPGPDGYETVDYQAQHGQSIRDHDDEKYLHQQATSTDVSMQ